MNPSPSGARVSPWVIALFGTVLLEVVTTPPRPISQPVVVNFGLIALFVTALVEGATLVVVRRNGRHGGPWADPRAGVRWVVAAVELALLLGITLVGALAMAIEAPRALELPSVVFIFWQAVASTAGLLFVLQALPAFPLAGADVVLAFAARRLPQLVATKLVARLGVTVALLVPALLALLPAVRGSPWFLLALGLGGVALWIGGKAAIREALLTELRLQAQRPECALAPELRQTLLAWPLPAAAAALQPLSPAQFANYQALAEAAFYGRRAGARTSSTRPTPSSATSSSTEAV